MKLIVIEGLDKTGKTTYIKSKLYSYKQIRMPGGSDYSQELRRFFLEGRIPKPEMIHMIYGEHMAILEKLIRENKQDCVLDRSFISYLVYQKDCLLEYGFYEIYKKLLEEKFKQIMSLYDVKILYFDQRLSEKKDDWLERIDTDELKKGFDELLNQELYKKYVNHINVV